MSAARARIETAGGAVDLCDQRVRKIGGVAGILAQCGADRIAVLECDVVGDQQLRNCVSDGPAAITIDRFQDPNGFGKHDAINITWISGRALRYNQTPRQFRLPAVVDHERADKDIGVQANHFRSARR